MPPATYIQRPVTYAESSEAKNRATPAISSEVPVRPIGTSTLPMVSSILVRSSPASINSSQKGVTMGPGLMQLTRMPSGATSIARLTGRDSQAPLAM